MFTQDLGSTLTDAMIATTSATRTDSAKTDPALSYLDVGLPNPAVISTQAAAIFVLGQGLVKGQKHWREFGFRAFGASISTLSNTVCLTLLCRDSCTDSTYSPRDTPERLHPADLAPYLNITRNLTTITCKTLQPSCQHVWHTDAQSLLTGLMHLLAAPRLMCLLAPACLLRLWLLHGVCFHCDAL